MRRILRYITALAALSALCLGAQFATVAGVASAAAGGPATANPALNRQVQEAIAKAQAQKAAGGGSGSAAGSSGSFSKLTEQSGGEQESAKGSTKTSATRKTESSSSGPLSAGVLLPLLVAIGGLLAAIAFLILRDARGVTPAGDLLAAASGSAEARAARLRKRRAKAKAARQQRKRNR
jgi:cobalamin biosynthesis Mg chelatase CobN